MVAISGAANRASPTAAGRLSNRVTRNPQSSNFENSRGSCCTWLLIKDGSKTEKVESKTDNTESKVDKAESKNDKAESKPEKVESKAEQPTSKAEKASTVAKS